MGALERAVSVRTGSAPAANAHGDLAGQEGGCPLPVESREESEDPKVQAQAAAAGRDGRPGLPGATAETRVRTQKEAQAKGAEDQAALEPVRSKQKVILDLYLKWT